MGERYLRFWKSKLGEKLFRLAGFKLKRVAPALGASEHRATEVVIGLEADRLFEALPKETRESLGTLPETVQALEQDAQAMRQQVAEMDGILAEIGDDDPSRPSAARACVRASKPRGKRHRGNCAKRSRRSRPFALVCSTCRPAREPLRASPWSSRPPGASQTTWRTCLRGTGKWSASCRSAGRPGYSPW